MFLNLSLSRVKIFSFWFLVAGIGYSMKLVNSHWVSGNLLINKICINILINIHNIFVVMFIAILYNT